MTTEGRTDVTNLDLGQSFEFLSNITILMTQLGTHDLNGATVKMDVQIFGKAIFN